MKATDAYEGYREFVLARGRALSHAAYLLTGDRSAAEELTQAALVKVALRWRRVLAAGNPEAYVRRILVNEHISSWRRFGRREQASAYQEIENRQTDPADVLAQRLNLAAALARLPGGSAPSSFCASTRTFRRRTPLPGWAARSGHSKVEPR